MEKNLGITKPRYREQILPHPCPFVVSRFHSNQPSRTMLTSMYLMPTFSLLSVCLFRIFPEIGLFED